jgi:peptidoglycan/LPS O-acetylase OafA/YrhL
MQRIKTLDSMRGLAASVVLFHHVYTRFPSLFLDKFPFWLQGFFNFISEMNVQAVMFFFFLSGFSICLSLKNGLPVAKEAFNEYAYRRLRRIVPLYYFAIVFTLFCGWLLDALYSNADFSLANFMGNIFFLQCSKSYHGNWFAPYGDNGPLWSLSFEMFYYFFLPVFLALLLKLYKVKVFDPVINRVALIAAFFLSLACVVLNKYFFFPYIAFAALFYVWYAGFFTAWLFIQKKLALDLNFFILLIMHGLLTAFYYLSPSATIGKLLFGNCIALCFFLAMVVKRYIPGIVKVTCNAFNFLFYTIGTGSYAIYLLHYPVLMLLKKYQCNTMWQMVLAILFTCIGCILLEHWFVKRKWLLFKREFVK